LAIKAKVCQGSVAADHVFNIPQMKGPRREEALARFEVAATQ